MRTASFAEALRNLAPARDRFMLTVQSSSRLATTLTWSVERALRRIAYDHADVLLLGYWNRGMSPRVLDAARALQRRGLVNFVAVSSHNRALAATLAGCGDFDIVHLRYNAAHPGLNATASRTCLPWAVRVVSFTGTSRASCWTRSTRRPEAHAHGGDCYRFALSHPDVNVCDRSGIDRPRRRGDRSTRTGPHVRRGTRLDEARRREVRRRAWLKQ